MYVIAGVTGHTGSAAATALLAAGKPVRVIVRDAAKGEPWKAKGADIAIADLGDRDALSRALAGATGAYLLLPPPSFGATDIARERGQKIEAILGAVRAARPGHVVLLSSLGAELPAGTGPIQYIHPLEEGLRASGVPTTIVRAGYFMDNWGAQLRDAVAAGKLFHAARPDLKLPQVATADIGTTAAKLLIEGAPKGTRVVELVGPAEITTGETAAILSKVAGKTVQSVTVPPSAVADMFVSQGASREFAMQFEEMLVAMNDGKVSPHGEVVRGTTTLEQRLRELLG
jgi:uncharacterized protein YbjT (DUF2867 family)